MLGKFRALGIVISFIVIIVIIIMIILVNTIKIM